MGTFKGFTSVELRKPKRSFFDMSHERRISTRMGRLTPLLIMETLPNDTIKCSSEVMLRLMPLLAPIMHRINVFVHFFFVPNRLLWDEWEEFITNGRLGTETPPLPPTISIADIQGLGVDALDEGTLADYLGLGTITDADAGYNGAGGGTQLHLMPFAAYYKVWYDYYRDRNYLADNELLPLPSGNVTDNPAYTAADVAAIMEVRKRDYQKDYYTSALLTTQRGAEVLMPLQGTGTVSYLDVSLVKSSTGADPNANELFGSGADASTDSQFTINKTNAADPGIAGRVENIDEVTLNSSEVSIRDLRTALKLQEWMERQMLAGSRMNETIWAHFNRRTSDGRLQRAEYLGGGKVDVRIGEVLTTAWSNDGTDDVPPANMAGRGISYGESNQFSYNCEEWGFVIGIMSIMPNTAYMQGSHRMFFQRNTFLDYPWPSFAHIGEQEVYKYELFQNATNTPEDHTTAPVFGYQSRYADWKYIPSSSHGDFKSSLDFWHLTRKFASSPSLGATFVGFEDTLQDRVFAISNVDTCICYVYNKCGVKRSLPYYGTPML